MKPIRVRVPAEKTRRNLGATGLYRVELEGAAIVVARTPEGYVGFQSRCPHAGAELYNAGHRREGGTILFCQRDGIYFSLEDGEATHNPTGEPAGCLSLIQVERDGDDFLIYFV